MDPQYSELARELIRSFYDARWRETELQVIHDLSALPCVRTLEFLFRIAIKGMQDIPMSIAAIRSLGKTHEKQAGQFLNHYFYSAPASIRPYIVAALGEVPDRTLRSEFLGLLRTAIQEEDRLLVKHLVLALGEFKEVEAIPEFLKCLRPEVDAEMRRSALVALGKTSRDPSHLQKCEALFEENYFDAQLFNQVRAQIQVRSEWRLEDYLKRIFESKGAHPAIVFELASFDATEVKSCLAAEQSDTRYIQEILGFEKPPESQFDQMDRFLADAFLEKGNESKLAQIEELASEALTAQTVEAKRSGLLRVIEKSLDLEQTDEVWSRWLRLAGQLNLSSNRIFQFVKKEIENPGRTQACLFWLAECAEKHGLAVLIDYLTLQTRVKSRKKIAEIESTPRKTTEEMLLTAFTRQERVPEDLPDLDSLLTELLAKEKLSAFDFLAKHPRSSHVNELHQVLESKLALPAKQKSKATKRVLSEVNQDLFKITEIQVQVAALRALKATYNENSPEVAAKFLGSPNKKVVFRCLDCLSGMKELRAKRILIDFLRDHSSDVEVCDKITRSLVPPETPTPYFSEVIAEILEKNPEHPQADTLIDFKRRLESASSSPVGAGRATPQGVELIAIDQVLSQKIESYFAIEDSVRSALRSAEIPYRYPNVFDETVDKASSILEYCKGLDLYLETEIGKKVLFPKLEVRLHDFQNVLHSVTLNDPYPNAEQVLKDLQLEKHFTTQSLPLHKMSLIAQSILNGKILNERFKVLDGLRAWAIILLVFSRKLGSKPVISIAGPSGALSDEMVISLSKKLIWLQDIRNPAAHRKTVLEFSDVDQVRDMSLGIISTFQKITHS